MLSKIASAGQNGQFRTPRHIIQLMVELTQPTPRDVVCDPACGTAGFLVAVGEALRRHHPNLFHNRGLREHFHSGLFHGFDFDNTMLRIGSMNMLLHWNRAAEHRLSWKPHRQRARRHGHIRRGLIVHCRDATESRSGRKGVRIVISDSGSGISASAHEHIFEAFYTTKALEGSGVGLWLTSEVIARHNGRVRLRSRTEGRYRGTIFDIFLPEHANDEDAEIRKSA